MKDFERMSGPAIYGVKHWKKEWLPLVSFFGPNSSEMFNVVASGMMVEILEEEKDNS